MRKLLLIPILISALAIGSYFLLREEPSVPVSVSVSKGIESSTLSETDLVADPTEETTDGSFSITLSFVGDCLCATDARTSYENCFEDVAAVKKPSYFLKKTNHIFSADDFTIGDCENVYSDSENLSMRDKGQIADPSIEAYWFKTKSKNAKILSAGGIDMVSIDNNHINDYGEQGRLDTQKALDDAGVQWGEAGKIIYYEKNGYKIAVICFSMYYSDMAAKGLEYIAEAEKNSDYQIIYFHGGTEAIHAPEDWKIQACHSFIDAGADLVIGDHPHVLQPREIYNNKTIIYSMGNFIFGGNRHPENRTIIYQHTLKVDISRQLTSEKGTIIPCYVYTGDTNNWQPDIIQDKNTKQRVLDFMNQKSDSPL